MKKSTILILAFFLTFSNYLLAENIRRDFSWVSTNSAGSPSSSVNVAECVPNVLVTLNTSGTNHKLGSVTSAHIPSPPNGCFLTTNTSAAIIAGSGSNTVNITLSFSNPVSNLQIHISDLDSPDPNGQQEYLNNFLVNGSSPSTGVLTTSGGQFSPPSGSFVVSPLNFNACGWVNYNVSGISSISFNYIRTWNQLGIFLDSLVFDCPASSVCCPNLNNLVTNPDFELGNTGFISQFSYDGSTPSLNSLLPGEYTITNNFGAQVICSNWNVCNSNGNFLVVNGSTNQLGQKLIWEQTINGIDAWKEYKFCAKLKNMPECCFDVKPRVDIKFNISGFDIIGEVIDEDVSDPCKWKEIEKSLFLTSSPGFITIQIWLDETGLGDGNDLAIDDIAFAELPKVPDAYTLFSTSLPVNIIGDLYSIIFSSPPLPNDCGCFWEVCELDPLTDECKTSLPNTKVSNDPLWWSIPTYCTSFNFAGYVGSNTLGSLSNPGEFDIKKTYRVTRGAFCKCGGWNQISHDIFEKNNRIIIRDSKTKKIIKQIPIQKKKKK